MRRRHLLPVLMLAAIGTCPAAAVALASPPATAAAVDDRVPPPHTARHTPTRIPEPDTIALFVLGAAGLLVGRRLSRTRRAPDA